ncbi:hypothetical protein [Paraburkholderia sp. C35]|uniref:hypothetical protein n=1 Tax=Paraburkholderia sp. C35 TaxID=2126993 RepID=UPI000D69D405|nr:hypothetical protein [Paraburkholderia sp. C35]
MQTRSDHSARSGDACGQGDSSIGRLTQLSSLQSDALIQYGARLIVVGELLEAIVANLKPATQAEIRAAFNARVDRLLVEPRARDLPDTYHTTIASEVEHFSKALGQA